MLACWCRIDIDRVFGSAHTITYDNGNETFNVQGAATTPGVATAPGNGRVRVVIMPKPELASPPVAEPKR